MDTIEKLKQLERYPLDKPFVYWGRVLIKHPNGSCLDCVFNDVDHRCSGLGCGGYHHYSIQGVDDELGE